MYDLKLFIQFFISKTLKLGIDLVHVKFLDKGLRNVTLVNNPSFNLLLFLLFLNNNVRSIDLFLLQFASEDLIHFLGSFGFLLGGIKLAHVDERISDFLLLLFDLLLGIFFRLFLCK